MDVLIRYLRLWRRFAIIAFVREAEYRANFLIGVGEGVAQLALAVLTFLLLYRFTDTVAGWSRAQVLVLVGVYRVADGLIGLQIAPNMFAISGYIRRGEMDFLLLRPVSSQFLTSLRMLELPEAVNALIGLALAIYAGNEAHVHWSVWGVAAAGAFGACGLVLTLRLVVRHGHAVFLAGASRHARHVVLQRVRDGALPGLVLQGPGAGAADLRRARRLCHDLPRAGPARHGRPTLPAGRPGPGRRRPRRDTPLLALRRAPLQQREQLIVALVQTGQ